ncbi:MAG: hypothetical protein AB7P23_06330 [Amphiplicatus sp.]
MAREDWKEQEKLLKDSFRNPQTGILTWDRLLPLVKREDAFGASISQTFAGFQILLECFHEFFLESHAFMEAEFSASLSTIPPNYIPTVFLYRTVFETFRAVARTTDCGYPLKAFGLLRSAREQLLIIGAIVRRYTTVPKVLGYDKILSDAENSDAVQKSIESERRYAIARMVGNKSELPSDVSDGLQKITDRFHDEIHSARLSFYLALGTIKQSGKFPPLSPQPSEEYENIAIYLNRMTELSWLLHRSLPFLRLQPGSFGQTWREKWNALDGSFSMHVRAVAATKPPIAAFQKFVAIKYPADVDLIYSE